MSEDYKLEGMLYALMLLGWLTSFLILPYFFLGTTGVIVFGGAFFGGMLVVVAFTLHGGWMEESFFAVGLPMTLDGKTAYRVFKKSNNDGRWNELLAYNEAGTQNEVALLGLHLCGQRSWIAGNTDRSERLSREETTELVLKNWRKIVKNLSKIKRFDKKAFRFKEGNA